jgi:hypothetical protein
MFVLINNPFLYFYSMKCRFIFLVTIVALIASCKSKTKTTGGKGLVSVVSLIKEQIAHVDTSLYSIIKLVSVDSLKTDTIYVRREEFGTVSKEFLSLPELSDPAVAKNYKEESRYDTLTKKAVISYYPTNEENEIKKIELMASIQEVGKDGNNKVTNILVEKGKTDRNGSLIKKMYWNSDRNFTIITFSQLPGQPEKVETVKVIWNDDSYQ